MTGTEYKELSLKEFSKAARVYETDRGGIYKMCKKDYPDVLTELEKEEFTNLLDCGCGPAPMLTLLHEKYPDIKVTVTNGPTPDTLKLLREGKIDFGIVSTPFEKMDGMEANPVREIEDVFVAGRKFISFKNKMLDLQELERHVMLINGQKIFLSKIIKPQLFQNLVLKFLKMKENYIEFNYGI